MIKKALFVCIVVVLTACAATPKVTTVQEVSESAQAPYKNILVVALFASFDNRRYFEQEIVKQLSERGVKAVASTSMMNTKISPTRQVFLAMVEKIDADAVLVTHLVSLESKGAMKDRRPEATYNVRPTYYYNVWSVELTEYTEPKAMELKHSLVLATQLYSAHNREAIWAIEAESKIVRGPEERNDLSFIEDEAGAIIYHLSRDRLIAR